MRSEWLESLDWFNMEAAPALGEDLHGSSLRLTTEKRTNKNASWFFCFLFF